MIKKYEKYKSSGVEWIGEIPEHWEVRKLKYSAKINLSNVDKKTHGGQSRVKLCNYVDVYKNSKITSDIEFMEATATKEQINKFFLQKDDVLITKDSESPNDIAVPAYVSENMEHVICGYHLAHIKPKLITGLFLYYSFLTEKLKDQFCISANGITRYGLGKDSIGCSIFFVPPLLEQEKIASYLDTKSEAIDKFIKNKEELINLLEEEKKVIITKAVTKGIDPNINLKNSCVDWLGEISEHWEAVPFTKFCLSQVDYRGKTPEKVENGVFLITTKNIKNSVIDYEISKEYIKEKDYKKVMSRGLPKVDDILFTMEAPLGEVALVDREDVALAQRIIKFRLKESIYPKYCKYFMYCTKFKDFLYSEGTGSTAIGLKASKLHKLKIPLPPVFEQQAIVAYLDEETKKIDDLKAKYRQEIELIKEYKERLIYDVVTGKMSVLEH
jgi:type I restriction enzyme, S subunit